MVLDVVLQGFIGDGGRGKRIDIATRLGLLSHDYQFRPTHPADSDCALDCAVTARRIIMYMFLALKPTTQPLTYTLEIQRCL